jgi:hypothetical protein
VKIRPTNEIADAVRGKGVDPENVGMDKILKSWTHWIKTKPCGAT